MELVKGSVAVSLMGRDKGVLMCVVETGENRVWVCDGKCRKLNKPKAKNPKHIKPLNKKLSEEQLEKRVAYEVSVSKLEMVEDC